MVMLVVGVVLLACALTALAGAYRIVAEAFHDSVYLGLLVMFVPPVLVIFVLARWSMCWPGTKRLVTGGAAFALTWTFAVPVVRSSGDLAKMRKAAGFLENAHDAPYKCPVDPKASAGFGTYCCTRQGWQLVTHGGCSSTYRPTTVCNPTRLGVVEETVCGTVGRPLPLIQRE